MRKTNIKHIAVTAIMGLLLNACGGGSSSTTSFPVAECGTEVDKGKSLASDVTDKTIEKVHEGAEVRIWHSPDGTKLACMISGEARIVDN